MEDASKNQAIIQTQIETVTDYLIANISPFSLLFTFSAIAQEKTQSAGGHLFSAFDGLGKTAGHYSPCQENLILCLLTSHEQILYRLTALAASLPQAIPTNGWH